MKQNALFSKNQYEPAYPDAAGWKGGDTSRQAAASVDAETLRAKVLERLRLFGMATADELASGLETDKLSIRPRLSELKALGRVVATHERRYNASGKRAIVWKLAPRGER